jgi:hypothetical protein
MNQIMNIGNDQLELDNKNASGIWRAKIVINRVNITSCIDRSFKIHNELERLLNMYNSNLDNEDKEYHIKLKTRE